MSEELKAMFKEAERRGDRKTAEAILMRLEQTPTVQPTAKPEQPAGMTYSGIPGRIQMDVGMGKTPTQVGGSALFEATKGFIDWAGDEISSLTPQVAKDWLQYELGSAVNAMPKSFVKSMSKGLASVQQWIADNPEKARGVEALIMAGGAAYAPIKQGMKAGTYDQALMNTLKPYMNEHNKSEMLEDGRLKSGYIGGGRAAVDEQGWGRGIGKTIFTVNKDVARQKRALSTVPGFSPYQTNIRRLEVVNDEIVNASKALQRNLDDLGKTPAGRIQKQDLKKYFSKANVQSVFNKQKGVTRNTFLSDDEYARILADIKYYIR
ncbi:MAG: hypothetical protein KJO69_09310, partial [Gammaproteobacteria bacterium]|nr:hypothetical protein [Gammaproteobacteria bacterium]